MLHVAFHSPSRFQFSSSRRILLTPGVACCLFESCHRDCRKIFDCRSLIVHVPVGQCALCPVAQPLTYVARRVGKLPTTVKGPIRRVRRLRDLHRTWASYQDVSVPLLLGVHNSPMEEQHQRMRWNTLIGAMALLGNVDGTLLTPPTKPPKRTSHLGKFGVQKHFLTARFLPRLAKLSARLLLRFFFKGSPCGLGLSEGIELENGLFCLWMRSLYPSSAHVPPVLGRVL